MPSPRDPGAPSGTRVEVHPDFRILEERVGELLRAAKGRGARGTLAPVLIVAPTRSLLAYLQEVLGGSFPAGLLNVRFSHHAALARAIAAQAGVSLPSLLGDAAKEAILSEVLRKASRELADFVASRPGSIAALLSTMEHLREAGVDPGEAAGVEGLSSEGRTAVRLYGGYAAALDALTPRGWSDGAGRIAAAARHASGYASRFRLVIHYGAYELIGVNLDLMRALESGSTPVVYLSPGHPRAPAFAFARRFWSGIGLDPVMLPDRPAAPSGGPGAPDRPSGARLFGDRLTLLYDEEAAPPPPDRPLDLTHSQGARSELREAALSILARHRDCGTPLARMAIIARSLEPYAPLLGSVFSEHRLPITTTATLSAAREPGVRAALFLARCLRDDFPAGPLFDLLRSGRLLGVDEPQHEIDAWERLGRERRVAAGEMAWRENLPRWAELWEPPQAEGADERRRAEADRGRVRRRALARRLASLVGGLADARREVEAAGTWTAWAERFRDLLAARIDGYQAVASGDDSSTAPAVGAAAEVILNALEDMPALETAGVGFNDAAAVESLERAVARARLPIGSLDPDGHPQEGDRGGVRILEAMGSRGLAFEVVHLLGMNADQFPRREREDPFLPDDDRRRIREALRRPLSVAVESVDEEHLLLAHLAGSAGDRLAISWQRADEEGKARVPALALREFGRIALGTTDLKIAEARAVRIPADPIDQSLDAVSRHRLLAPKEAAFAPALAARGPGPAAAILEHVDLEGLGIVRGDLLPGLRFLEEIEGGPAPTPFDALPGGPSREEPWSPSRLETLGSCPQQYFFRHELRASEWEETAAPHDIEAREIGAVVHAVLRSLYATLLREELLDGKTALETVLGRAEACLETAWTEHAGHLLARFRGRLPALGTLIAEEWQSALRRFLRLDLADLLACGRALEGCETDVTRDLRVGPGDERLTVRGRFDRIGRDRDGVLVISDYKTSGPLERHVSRLEMLRGSRLQMGLYILMAAADQDPAGRRDVRAEVLGVGPRYAEEEAAAPGPARATLDAAGFEAVREGVIETLGVLAGLAKRGLFPLHAESRLCPFCPFTRACRKNHRPTRERLADLPELRDYFRTLRKTSAKPLLAAVASEEGDR